MKKILLSLVALVFSTCLFAQTLPFVSYHKQNDSEVKVPDSAFYIRTITAPDSGSKLYNFKEVFKNGVVKRTGKSTRANFVIADGECTSYYPSGIKEQVANYKEGGQLGDVYHYFPNGKLYNHKRFPSSPSVPGSVQDDATIISCYDSTGKALVTDGNGHYVGYNDDFRFLGYTEAFKTVFEEGEVSNGLRQGEWKGTVGDEKPLTFVETYDMGKLTKGISLGHDGVSNTYTAREEQPQYPGGYEMFYQFLGSEVKYPKAAKRAGITGRVFITFVVERDGSLTDIKVVRTPSADLGEEGARVVKISPKWLPGKQFGRPVRVQFTIPINFALN